MVRRNGKRRNCKRRNDKRRMGKEMKEREGKEKEKSTVLDVQKIDLVFLQMQNILSILK